MAMCLKTLVVDRGDRIDMSLTDIIIATRV